MLTTCDYDPGYCERGDSYTVTALLLIGGLIVVFAVIEYARSVRADRKRRDRAGKYPPSWLD